MLVHLEYCTNIYLLNQMLVFVPSAGAGPTLLAKGNVLYMNTTNVTVKGNLPQCLYMVNIA